MTVLPGQVFGGRYRIERHLARGGMAEVYVARDTLLHRPVALKVLFPELAADATFVERFRREAQSAARLNHRNIVSVFDFGQDGSTFYIVMEYVEGRPLNEIIATEGPLAPGRAVAIAADVAAGLEAAHREGIIHRDVKPANVLVTATVAKVADFGIARVSAARLALTMPGTVIGTATYLSPEQAQVAEVDQRSDVYSLGLVLYEMLTATPPFRGDNLPAVFYQQQHQLPPPPSSINPTVPAALDAAVARAVSFDPSGRQVSAAALRAEIIAAVGSAGAAVVEPPVVDAALAPTSVQLPPERPLAVVEGAPEVAAGGATDVLPAGAPAARTPLGPSPGGSPQVVDAEEEVARRRRAAALMAGLAAVVAVVIAAIVLSHNQNGGATAGTTVPSSVVVTPTPSTVAPTTVAPESTRAATPATRAATTTASTLPPTTVTATTSPPATTASTRLTTPSTSPATTLTPPTT